jgi:pimeloyl-ACP methyl ester carboxylesterase
VRSQARGRAVGERVGVAAAATALALAVAACTSPPSGSRPPRTTAGTTTTTLPAPVLLGGTTPPTPLSFLGPVMRVTAQLLPVGVPAAGPSGATGPSGGTASADASGRSTPLPGVTVAFRQFGSGPDLVLVMGQSGSMSWWDPSFLENLQPRYRVTIFDLPGVGWSGDAPGLAPSVEAYSDVTAGLLAALGIRHPVLMGWGMGGEVAMEVALRHPGSVAKLVLVDTSSGGPGAAATPRGVAAAFASSATTPSRFASLLFPTGDSGDRAAWLLDMLQEGPDDVVAAAVAAEAAAQQAWWGTGASAADLSRITLPTMVVWGDADGVFPPSDGRALAAMMPSAQAIAFSGAGYASLFQQNAFVADLEAFSGT